MEKMPRSVVCSWDLELWYSEISFEVGKQVETVRQMNLPSYYGSVGNWWLWFHTHMYFVHMHQLQWAMKLAMGKQRMLMVTQRVLIKRRRRRRLLMKGLKVLHAAMASGMGHIAFKRQYSDEVIYERGFWVHVLTKALWFLEIVCSWSCKPGPWEDAWGGGRILQSRLGWMDAVLVAGAGDAQLSPSIVWSFNQNDAALFEVNFGLSTHVKFPLHCSVMFVPMAFYWKIPPLDICFLQAFFGF